MKEKTKELVRLLFLDNEWKILQRSAKFRRALSNAKDTPDSLATLFSLGDRILRKVEDE